MHLYTREGFFKASTDIIPKWQGVNVEPIALSDPGTSSFGKKKGVSGSRQAVFRGRVKGWAGRSGTLIFLGFFMNDDCHCSLLKKICNTFKHAHLPFVTSDFNSTEPRLSCRNTWSLKSPQCPREKTSEDLD